MARGKIIGELQQKHNKPVRLYPKCGLCKQSVAPIMTVKDEAERVLWEGCSRCMEQETMRAVIGFGGLAKRVEQLEFVLTKLME